MTRALIQRLPCLSPVPTSNRLPACSRSNVLVMKVRLIFLPYRFELSRFKTIGIDPTRVNFLDSQVKPYPKEAPSIWSNVQQDRQFENPFPTICFAAFENM